MNLRRSKVSLLFRLVDLEHHLGRWLETRRFTLALIGDEG